MTIKLLNGVYFKAELRSSNIIQWSWGRDNFKTNTHSIHANKSTKKAVDNTAKELNRILKQKGFNVDIPTDIKKTKEAFLEWVKDYGVDE